MMLFQGLCFQVGIFVIVPTAAEEIYKSKGFHPMLSFEHRKEIVLSIKYVQEVVKSRWLIDERFMDLHHVDLLVHGEDNRNPIPDEKLVIFERTTGISSSQLRNSTTG